MCLCHVNTPYAFVVNLCICNLADIRFGLVIPDPSTSRVSEFTPFSESAQTGERLFSAMRRIKNYLRATMGDERLSNLSMMHIHRSRHVAISTIIDRFAANKNKRLDLV